MTRTLRATLRLLTVAVLLAAGAAVAPTHAASGFEIFQPIPQRQAATDWTVHGASAELNAALGAYETNPNAATAVNVLKHYKEFQAKEPMRRALLAADPHLFNTVDAVKYEIIMAVRKRIAGVVRSKRFGSTGAREAALIQWMKNGYPTDERMPKLNPQSQFNTDDDISLQVAVAVAAGDPLADDKVNGSIAEDEFRAVTRDWGQRYGVESELDPKIVDVEFLSPTQAWGVVQGLGARPAWRNYFYAWTASNDEKYNDMFGVEQLEHWGFEKGYVTLDVHDPTNTTRPMAEVLPAPGERPAHGKFAYIAGNYRQAYVNHKGEFFYQCKYLARMIDAWRAVHGPDGLPDGWQEARNKAFAVYKNGDAETAKTFRFEVQDWVDKVVGQAHEYQLGRTGDALVRALRTANLEPDQRVSLDVLAASNPGLIDELDGLIVAYANVPETLQKKLAQQFEARIQATAASEDGAEILKSEAFKHILETVQSESGATRRQIDAFKSIRETVKQNLGELLRATDLDRFLERIAAGEMRMDDLTIEDGKVRRVERQLRPEDVARDVSFIKHRVKLINAVSVLFGWEQANYTAEFRRYVDEGPSTALMLLRRLHDVCDATRARPFHFRYTAEDGTEKQFTVHPSSRNFGVHLYKAALKGHDIWGKAKNGKQIYDELYKIFVTKGLTPEQQGQALAGIFAAALDVYDLLNKDVFAAGMFDIKGTGVLQQIALGTPGAALAGDEQAVRQLLGATFKDLILLYQPELAPVFIVFELGAWGVKEYSLSAARGGVLDLMVENGSWELQTAAGSWRTLTLELFEEEQISDPSRMRLIAVRRGGTGGSVMKLMLTKKIPEFQLLESKQLVNARKSMIDVAYDAGDFDKDPLLKVSVDAINGLLGQAKFLDFSKPSGNSRYWDAETWKKYGIELSREEDEVYKVPADVMPRPPAGSGSDVLWNRLTRNQMRLLGYLVADFWVKRQLLLEKKLLVSMEKEAARRLLQKLKTQQVQAGNYDFSVEIAAIDDLVQAIDRKLWPRLADSCLPFAVPYDPDRDTPILERFVSATGKDREALERFEAFLNDPTMTSIGVTEEVFLPAEGPATVNIGRDEAERQATALLTGMRDNYFRLLDRYEKVHATLDAGKKRVGGEGNLALERFHLDLAIGMTTPLDAAQELFRAGGYAEQRAEDWLGNYREQRIRVMKDIEQLGREHAVPDGMLEVLLDSIAQIFSDPNLDGTPSHPLWGDLVRLRYQIHKVGLMRNHQAGLEQAEFAEHLRRMTLEPGQAVEVPSKDNTGERGAFLVELARKMEQEYRKLLERLTEMFDTKVALDPDPAQRSPFIGEIFAAEAQFVPSGGSASATLGPHGFPDYVKHFEWTILDERSSPVGAAERTTEPRWEPRLFEIGLHLIKVNVLDQGGNVLSTASAGTTGEPITLTGSIAAEGDHDREPISVLGGAAVRGTVDTLGVFDFTLTSYDPALWDAGGTAQATVEIEDTTYVSQISAVTPITGGLVLDDELQLELPYDVDLEVKVVDRAKLDVNEKRYEATLSIGGRPLAPGRTVRAKVERDQPIDARVRFLPFDLVADAAPVTFDPDAGRSVELEIELPIYDVDHVTFTGRFALPQPAPGPAQIASGTVRSNVRTISPFAGESFSFTNEKPIDLRGEARINLEAAVQDDAGKRYRPVTEPVTQIIAAEIVDLQTIDLQPAGATLTVEVRLFDHTGAALPADQGWVEVAGQRIAGQAGVFSATHTFDARDEVLTIVGGASLPGGREVRDGAEVQASSIVDWDNPVSPRGVDIQLGFYLPGNLTLTGTPDVTVCGTGQPPQDVSVEATAHRLSATVAADAPFSLALPGPVVVGETIDVELSADSDGTNYRGTGQAQAPAQPGTPAELGQIALGGGSPGDVDRVKEMVARCEYRPAEELARNIAACDPNEPWIVANLADLTTQAEAQARVEPHLDAARRAETQDLEQAIRMLELAEAERPPQCVLDEIAKARRGLEQRQRFVELTEAAARESNENCDFDAATSAVRQVEGLTPRETWIAQWLDGEGKKIQELATRDVEATRLVEQARREIATRPGEPEAEQAAAGLLRQAMEKAPACRQREILGDPQLAGLLPGAAGQASQIKASIVLLIDASGSMSGNGKMDQAKRAAKASARKASRHTQIAVLAFEGGCGPGAVHEVQGFSTDPNALIRAIDTIQPGGGTPMFISVGVATEYAKTKGQGSRSVILMSDGGDSCRNQQAAAGVKISRHQVTVNTIGFDVAGNAQAQDDLQRVATMTGGRTFSAGAGDPAEIVRAFELAMLPSLLRDIDLSADGSGDLGRAVQEGKRELAAQNLDGAVREYKRAHDLNPSSPALNYNMSLLYEAQDRLNPAVEHARKYISLSPNAFDRSDVEQRIGLLEAELKANPRTQYDSGACRELYLWAEREKRKAKKPVARRQAVLTILIAAQRGKCTEAENLIKRYRAEWGR